MLFYFDISIKREDLEKAKIHEQLVEWGGELYTQDPPLYEYDGILIFEESLNNSYYKNYYGEFIGSDFDIDKYRTFHLKGKYMSEIEVLVNRDISNLTNHVLCKFLIDLSELDEFAIFLIRDEEEMEERYRINTSKELIRTFCNCFNWDNPKGALITKLKKNHIKQ